jgi:serine/threonine protein kinase
MNTNNNAQQLNITTILSKNTDIQDEHNTKNINFINTIFNNTDTIEMKNKKKYEIKKYLGEGIQGSLYMALDNNNNKFICKQINLNENTNPNQINQLNFELNLLKFLSSNRVTREYINPCLEYKIINNQVLTLFPVFNGYSLTNIKKYLLEMKHKNYYRILFHLIKIILHGLAKIHQHNIAHQNINENSILISTFENNNEIKIKFTDFGLGCGVNNEINNIFYDVNSCNVNTITPNTPSQTIPNKITTSLIKKLSKTESLNIAQKNDIKLLTLIFIQLLLFFENIKLDLSQGYNNTIKEQIKKIITEKFLSKIQKYRKNKYAKEDDIFNFITTKNETKRDILEYLNIFNDFVLCENKNIQSCQNILDKLIIYEKYKNEVF